MMFQRTKCNLILPIFFIFTISWSISSGNTPPPLCVYPPPIVAPITPLSPLLSQPPPHYMKPPEHRVWCVAMPTVPPSLLQLAMDYACGSGADCVSIQPNGLCYQPDTVLAHASYAFNSYWQRTKGAGGTCSFGGLAMLVTLDPSYDQCHFIYG